MFVIMALALPILATGLAAYQVKVGQAGLRLILAGSAGYLFSISIIHLLPEAFLSGGGKITGLFIVLGFCLQLVIDTFSTGIEHGHVHLHSDTCHKHLPTGIVVGLFLHSFLEGLPVYDPHQNNTHHVNFQLLLGLAIHNLPITIAFVTLLKEHGNLRTKNTALLALFAFMSPLGFIFSYLLQSIGLKDYHTYSEAAFAVVIGIFLHISTAILFESGVQHRYNVRKVAAMAFGVVLAYILS